MTSASVPVSREGLTEERLGEIEALPARLLDMPQTYAPTAATTIQGLLAEVRRLTEELASYQRMFHRHTTSSQKHYDEAVEERCAAQAEVERLTDINERAKARIGGWNLDMRSGANWQVDIILRILNGEAQP